MESPSILIIDDEPAIRKLLEITLQGNGYKALSAVNGQEGITLAAMHSPDLILLDLGLPDQDGQEVLIHLREWFTSPILILSVCSSEDEVVKALDHGANDYLIKPFRPGELLARIRSAIRLAQSGEQQPVQQFGTLTIDAASRTVRKNGEFLKLTSTEYALLSLFVRNEGKVLTHSFILREIWGPGYIAQTQYPRVFVGQLRKKIEDEPDQPRFILTESGVGYRFVGNT
jgi:two-component system KDP operon response regulator KdpE